MILNFGTNINRVQLVMELDIAQPDERKISNKLMKGKSVISIQHLIAGTAAPEAAVIIWDGQKLIKSLFGSWDFHHQISGKCCYENYLQFTPQIDIKTVKLDTVDVSTDEHYLYFTFLNYKKL